MTLGEVVKDHPECVETILGYGLHCVGCHAAYSETIEEGAKAHGLSDEELGKMLEDLNAVVSKTSDSSPPDPGLALTKKAADMLKSIFAEQKKEGCGLRITASPGGCSGLMYEFDFEKEPSADDNVVEADGVKIFLDPDSFKLLKGSRIDYVTSPSGEGFRVDNPNPSSHCECGSH